MSFRAAAIIPVYNHPYTIVDVVAKLRKWKLFVLLVDDGSDQPTRSILDSLGQDADENIVLHRLDRNRGKGAALLEGFEILATHGYTHALQVDADAQHDLDETGNLLSLAVAEPEALISALPRYDDSVPMSRYYGRRLTHLLVRVETHSREIRDSMCGFRVYPLALSRALSRRIRLGSRMEFDTEIMVRLYRAGVPIRFHPVAVCYPEQGISHFRMIRDNLRMTWLHIRLLAGFRHRREPPARDPARHMPPE